MNEKLGKSLDMVWIQANRHCVRHRLCDPADGLSLEQVRSIASSMLDFFENEAEDQRERNKGVEQVLPGSSGNPGNSALRSRLRPSEQTNFR